MFTRWAATILLAMAAAGCDTASRDGAPIEPADLILHNGRVVTVDDAFSIRQAIAVKDGVITGVGSNAAMLRHQGDQTQVIDLHGRMVLPGLMDSHTHPGGAAMYEFDHEIPTMRSVADVLRYVRDRAAALDAGQWIVMQQVFITRLAERRYPTRAELDEAAPNHPVFFRTGPDASLNSAAMRELKLTRDTKEPDGSRIERDASGEPTGILRGWSNMVSIPSTGRTPTEQDEYDRLLLLLRDYSANGLTAIADRAASEAAINRYEQISRRGDLSVRVAVSWHVTTGDDTTKIQQRIRQISQHPLARPAAAATAPDPAYLVRIVGVKTFLDGGMLTGSALMREPWGVSDIYSIDDPHYHGLRFIEQDKLTALARTAAESGLQFTAHSVGDGAVHAMLDAYAEVDRQLPTGALKATRPCITHCNFMSAEAIERMRSLGVVADIQPAWLYLDAATLTKQFGDERMRYFQPLATLFRKGVIAGGGSDHMQKIGSMRSVNPYNPFLGMWTAITRRGLGHGGAVHPEEALTRQQAIRFYTTHNAHILFLDRAGSLEPGKAADMIVIDRDILTCPVDEIMTTRVLRTYLGGRVVHSAE